MSGSLPFFLEQYLIRNWWGKKNHNYNVLTFYIHSMKAETAEIFRCNIG